MSKRPSGLVDLALRLQGAKESEPLKAFAAEVVGACDVSAVEMRRRVYLAVEQLRDATRG